MTTLKKMAVASALAGSVLLVPSAFAMGGYSKGFKDCDKSGYASKRGGQGFHKGKRGDKLLLRSIYSLDLSMSQEAKIDGYVKEFEDSRKKMFEVFGEDGFDKEAFIKSRVNKRENMIKAKAQLLEKIYNVLSVTQRKELKEKMNDFYDNKRARYKRSWG